MNVIMYLLDVMIQFILLLGLLGVIAFIIYGPYFLIIHLLDKPIRQRFFKQTKNNKQKVSPNFKQLIIVFESIISMLTRIAKSDGVISKLEADVIKDSITHFIAIARQEGLSTTKLFKLRKKLVQAHNETKNGYYTIDTYAKNLINYDSYMKRQVLRQLIFMASIDGYTSLKESLIINAGRTLGFQNSQIRSYIDDLLGIKKEFSQENISGYTTLGCKSTDDNATIKKKYRELVKKYHPDFRVDDESLKFRKQKMQEINNAYDIIKKERKL